MNAAIQVLERQLGDYSYLLQHIFDSNFSTMAEKALSAAVTTAKDTSTRSTSGTILTAADNLSTQGKL